ncbi:prepilin-type N-terminal cleavage/methylation domain-containing protein [Candidatus Gottesmanbacteria bacterium]|nr:prepilin-type N-terminal cleavage/methylation domain-containing protein [Candidatus Gottesmanbacteria bacterium]
MKRPDYSLPHSGFSLVELLVTVSIIAILIAIGIASYATINKQSRDAKRKSDMEQVRAALEMYRTDNGFYPSVGSGSWTAASSATDALAGLTPILVPTYMGAIPTDPKSSQSYMYLAKNAVGGVYYGYCISSQLESENPADTCTDTLPPGHTYGLKNP